MQLFLGSDHGGYAHKEIIQDYLKEKGYQVLDLGVFEDVKSVDYPDIAREVGEKVVENEGSFGILICGTGMGMAMAANKLDGVRAVTAHDVTTARLARKHNNANILSLGQRVVGSGVAIDMVEAFLESEFEGGRHERRVDKVTAIENH